MVGIVRNAAETGTSGAKNLAPFEARSTPRLLIVVVHSPAGEV